MNLLTKIWRKIKPFSKLDECRKWHENLADLYSKADAMTPPQLSQAEEVVKMNRRFAKAIKLGGPSITFLEMSQYHTDCAETREALAKMRTAELAIHDQQRATMHREFAKACFEAAHMR